MTLPLRLRPWTLKQAYAFCAKVHRRLPKVRHGLFCISLKLEDVVVVGVAIVGLPAPMLEGCPNGCSMLYGACSRAVRATGADNCVTYTHGDEHGSSLKASGWVYGGMTDGGEWSRESRPRQPAVDSAPKHRWWAPWSKAICPVGT